MKRNTFITGQTLALLGFLAAYTGVLAALVWADNTANRGITVRPDPAPIPYTDPAIGVNLYNIQFEVEQAKIDRTLDMARDMGARYVRLHMPWEDIEISGKGDFTDRRNDPPRDAWAKYDTLIAGLKSRGLEPIVRLDRPPDWARQQAIATPAFQELKARNGNATGPADNPQDYVDFVATVAGRYREQVRFYQIWNEPNLAEEWNAQNADPEAFTALLQQSARAVRAQNPAAVILFPSLAPTDGLDPTAPLTELEYLDRVYQAGGASAFDILSAQAYGLGQPPEEHRYVFLRGRGNWNWRQPIDTRIDVSRLVLLREVMERHGDTRAIWISEFGYNAAPEGIPDRARWGQPVSEQQKGDYLLGQIARARREWPWVGVMNVWFLRWSGADPDPNDPTPYFALVDRDFQPLPAYTALQRALNGPTIAGVGAHAWQHPAVQTIGDGWQVRFSGQALTLTGSGEVSVVLDGQPPHSFTLRAGEPTTVAADLPDTVHTVSIRAATPPETFVVSRSQPFGWVWTLALGLATAGLVFLSGWLMLPPRPRIRRQRQSPP